MSVNRPCCIDIYSGDNVSDDPTPLAGFGLVKASGIAFLFHKASEGTAYHDPRYAVRRLAWMSGPAIAVTDVDGASLSLPPRWGAYHFFHGQDPAAEAKSFLAAAALTPADAACCDWENVGASGYVPSASAVDAFCNRVEDAIGRPCWVYGGNVPREQLTSRLTQGMIDRFAKRPLWFCEYASVLQGVPLPWQSIGPALWQDDGDTYGPGPHRIPGITTLCDNSTVVGSMTIAKLNAIWSGKP
jgi:GH25 family lysozyme M1 (1,4-beta-N-acetylmuramidase)